MEHNEQKLMSSQCMSDVVMFCDNNY